MMGLLHRGGLRAQVLDEGELRVGDPVEVSEDAAAELQGATGTGRRAHGDGE